MLMMRQLRTYGRVCKKSYGYSVNYQSKRIRQKMRINSGSFIIEELTDLVEEAVLTEFDRITERGGVLVLWKTMYQEK